MYFFPGMSDDGREEVSVSSEHARPMPLFPVHVHFLGSNLYRGTLYDIDGFTLIGNSGRNLNVYRHEMTEAFNNGQLRFLHRVTPGYRFSVTSLAQYNNFINARNNKWRLPTENNHFYVYDDTDCDYTHSHFDGCILNF